MSGKVLVRVWGWGWCVLGVADRSRLGLLLDIPQYTGQQRIIQLQISIALKLRDQTFSFVCQMEIVSFF